MGDLRFAATSRVAEILAARSCEPRMLVRAEGVRTQLATPYRSANKVMRALESRVPRSHREISMSYDDTIRERIVVEYAHFRTYALRQHPDVSSLTDFYRHKEHNDLFLRDLQCAVALNSFSLTEKDPVDIYLRIDPQHPEYVDVLVKLLGGHKREDELHYTKLNNDETLRECDFGLFFVARFVTAVGLYEWFGEYITVKVRKSSCKVVHTNRIDGVRVEKVRLPSIAIRHLVVFEVEDTQGRLHRIHNCFLNALTVRSTIRVKNPSAVDVDIHERMHNGFLTNDFSLSFSQMYNPEHYGHAEYHDDVKPTMVWKPTVSMQSLGTDPQPPAGRLASWLTAAASRPASWLSAATTITDT